MTLSKLNRADRLRLMRFVCSEVWADLEVHKKEREFVRRMVRQLKLDEEEKKLVEGWLESPPPPEEVDPQTVPLEHRQIFLDALRAAAQADGTISSDELENLRLFATLVR